MIVTIPSVLLTKILSVEAQRLISVLRAQVQKKILRLPVRFFDNAKSGALVSRIMTDAEGIRNLVGTGIVQLAGGLITATVALGVGIQALVGLVYTGHNLGGTEEVGILVTGALWVTAGLALKARCPEEPSAAPLDA